MGFPFLGAHFRQQHIPKELLTQEWWDQRTNFLETKTIVKGIISPACILNYAHRFRPDWDFSSSISSPHQRVLDLLEEHSIEHEINNRKIIAPLELDIFIPSKNLAIEINGVYWHSELQGKDKNYHLNKTLECEKKGIQLIQFWDSELNKKWDIVSSMILAKCGIHKSKFGARQCLIEKIDSKTEQEFLNQNHLQGYRPSSICYGLYFKDELISLMSFGKPIFNKHFDWELLRFCNKLNTHVAGSASKLFNQRPQGSLISYSDRRYSNGELYSKLKMIKLEMSFPSYHYTNDYQTFYNRVKFQKHKLPNLLESFDPSLTEWENMKMNGYDRIWDCGNLKWVQLL